MPRIRFNGIAASRGIAIGSALLLKFEALHVRKKDVEPHESIDNEVERFKSAISDSSEQLNTLLEKNQGDDAIEVKNILEAHLMVLQDPVFLKMTEDMIRNEKVKAEFAIYKVIGNFLEQFRNMDNKVFQERAADFKDVRKRLLLTLQGGGHLDILDGIDEPVIIIAHDLVPSDTISFRGSDKILGFATDVGSTTSHATILARSMGLPAVVGLRTISKLVNTGDTVILDGTGGSVVLRPDEEELQSYRNEQDKMNAVKIELENLRELPAVTKDGHKVRIKGNIELPAEAELIKRYGAEGIGLFRSEFLFLEKEANIPDEDEQFEAYKSVVEAVAPDPVVIRTLDIGGDKFVSHLGLPEELNPFMGCRAIRFCLEQPEIFKIQLRAILRASAFGKVRLIYPMISGPKDLRMANKVLDEVKAELDEKGIEYDHDIEVGVMIEIPSAALRSHILAREVDFFSIGTNDLIQYTLAVDRSNERIANLYEPLHPAVLYLINITVKAALQENIWASVCGEMGSDPMISLILVGLGIDELSMGPPLIPDIKRIIRAVNYKDITNWAHTLLGFDSSDEIKSFMQEKLAGIL